MFSHVTLGSSNLERSAQFYSTVLGVLGRDLDSSTVEHGFVASTGPGDTGPWLVLCLPFDDMPASEGTVFGVRIGASSVDELDRVRKAAIQAGARALQDAQDDTSCMIVDPDGNRLRISAELAAGESAGTLQSVTTGCRDLDRAAAFYAETLAPLGIGHVAALDGAAVFGADDDRIGRLIVEQGNGGDVVLAGNGSHVAFNAGSVAAVDAFYEKALKAGGSCEGPPGLRPQYGEGYYAAYVRDPDGTKIQAVSRQAS